MTLRNLFVPAAAAAALLVSACDRFAENAPPLSAAEETALRARLHTSGKCIVLSSLVRGTVAQSDLSSPFAVTVSEWMEELHKDAVSAYARDATRLRIEVKQTEGLKNQILQELKKEIPQTPDAPPPLLTILRILRGECGHFVSPETGKRAAAAIKLYEAFATTAPSLAPPPSGQPEAPAPQPAPPPMPVPRAVPVQPAKDLRIA